MNNRIRLRVQGLTNSQVQSNAYALILAEEDGNRRIPIIVGTAEAQSIAIALEQITPPRPMTHDLFVSVAKAFYITLKEVQIYKFEEGVFFSQLVFDEDVLIDSRTSDAIAIAMRLNVPIFIEESIIDLCGIVIESDESDASTEIKDEVDLLDCEPEEIDDPEKLTLWLSLLDGDELAERLDEAVRAENYEHAKMYKDELKRRQEEAE